MGWGHRKADRIAIISRMAIMAKTRGAIAADQGIELFRAL